mgnify:CR=1 FL=1
MQHCAVFHRILSLLQITAFLESLHHQELTVDMGLSMVELAVEHKK